MAVHNGAAMISEQINHLLGLEPEVIQEIIVVSDGSTDATAEILLQFRDPRLRPIVLERRCGKAAALNHGVAAAQGDYLLFVDIRPRIETGSVARLVSNFADPSVGCVAGELILKTDGHDSTTSAVSGVYWRYEQWIRNCEAKFDSPVGVYGGFYAIRRNLATPAPDGLILDDMFQPLSVIRQGYRSVIDRSAVVSDIWPARSSGEFKRKVRTLAGNFQLFAVAPWLLTLKNRVLFQLVSHKVLRLIVPYCFIAVLIASTWLGFYSVWDRIFAVLQAVFWLTAALSLKIRIPFFHRLAAPAGALLVLNAAAVGGLLTFVFTRGPLWRIWSPTAAPESHA
jgi:glycosyltransferase involved in cell wall biosynthesis